MGLFETQAQPAAHPRRKRAILVVIALLLLVAFGWWLLRFYPEKRVVTRFLDAVVAGDLKAAYQLWQPGPEYSFEDFRQDWGSGSPWGTIRSYEITDVEGKSGVVSFTIVINGVATNPVELWVQKQAKALSFAPP
jgi:hypothetical protein